MQTMPLDCRLISLRVAGWLLLGIAATTVLADDPVRPRSDPPEIVSSWDDLTTGIKTPADWESHRKVLHKRFLDLIRDQRTTYWNVTTVHTATGLPLTLYGA